MHPVFMEGLAAEHIKAMTQVADRTRLVRQARRTRYRKSASRTDRRTPAPAGHSCAQPGDEVATVDGFMVNLSELACARAPQPWRSGARA